MTLVIDASVLVAATSDGGRDGSWAEDVLGSGPLVAPHLVLVESASILSRLERTRALTRLEASAAFRDLLRLEIDLLPFEPFAERIWQLRPGVTTYDAWYVAIAEALGLPLATLDRRLTRANGPSCRFLVPT